MTVSAWVGRVLIGASIGLLVVAVVCFITGLRFNTTKSIPVGVYRLIDAPVGKGEYVIFCPPRSALFDEARERGYIGAGFCPGGYGYLMKRVLATAGDKVASGDAGIAVNGDLLPASSPREVDGGGRAMPRCAYSDYTLKAFELLLMSDGSPTSFDGRYFGPVDVAQVRGVVKPVIVF